MKSMFFASTLVLALAISVGLCQADTWNLQVVDDAGDVGYDSQIVTLSDGTPYIFYKSSTDNLYLAWWVSDGGGGGGWQYRYLDNYTRNGTTFEAIVDATNRIHIAYSRYTSPAVRYGIYDPATQTWTLPLETVTGAPTSVFVDLLLTQIGADLVPVICANGENGKVYVYKRDPATGVWSNTIVDTLHTATHGGSVAVDAAHNMHVSFYENDGDNLMYATKTWDATTWQVSTVDITGNVGDYSSILVDASNRVHIVYYDTTNGDLKHAVLTP